MKPYLKSILLISILHFAGAFLLKYITNMPFNVTLQLVSALIFGVLITAVLAIVKFWKQQWQNKHN